MQVIEARAAVDETGYKHMRWLPLKVKLNIEDEAADAALELL